MDPNQNQSPATTYSPMISRKQTTNDDSSKNDDEIDYRMIYKIICKQKIPKLTEQQKKWLQSFETIETNFDLNVIYLIITKLLTLHQPMISNDNHKMFEQLMNTLQKWKLYLDTNDREKMDEKIEKIYNNFQNKLRLKSKSQTPTTIKEKKQKIEKDLLENGNVGYFLRKYPKLLMKEYRGLVEEFIDSIDFSKQQSSSSSTPEASSNE